MKNTETFILTRSEVETLADLPETIQAVEQAFRQYAEGKITGAGILDVPGRGGMFHIKAAGMPFDAEKIYVAVKVNGNFPDNRKNFELPTIQGAILLCDGIRGFPLAIMDSTEITARRTAAATAVAARVLARKDSHVVTMCGCGRQAEMQFMALKHVLPIERCFAFDLDETSMQRFCEAIHTKTGIPVSAVTTHEEATLQSDVIVTCTTSKKYFLRKSDVKPGTFVAAVGADGPSKQEIDPLLLKCATTVADILEQCLRMGDLHHAIEQNVMQASEVHGEIGEILCGRKTGRTSPEEITVFDSTGSAIQDAAAAAIVYERALKESVGARINLFL